MKRLSMKRIAAVVALSVVAAVTASASAAPAPKATGGVGFSYPATNGIQRHVSFAAIQSTTDTCGAFWSVETVGQFTFYLNGDLTNTPYTHHVTLDQAGQTVTGNGGYPVTGPPDDFHWNITSGSLVGTTLTLSMTYDVGAPGVVMTMSGTIAPNGSISGTWTDNYGGTRTGTFTAPAGSATVVASYCGKGTFYYSDEQGSWYFGVVKAVSVSGNTAWFATQILVSSSNLGFENSPATNWLFTKVTDLGEPGINVDLLGVENVMDQVTAINHVINKDNTSLGNVTINEGNIQVH
jgi:hypothetical protein